MKFSRPRLLNPCSSWKNFFSNELRDTIEIARVLQGSFKNYVDKMRWVAGQKVDHLFCNHFSRKMKKSGQRNLVREIWFKKSGSRKVVDQKKRWFYTVNQHFF